MDPNDIGASLKSPLPCYSMVDEAKDHNNSVITSLFPLTDILLDPPHSPPKDLVDYGHDCADDGNDDDVDDEDPAAAAAADRVALHSDCTYY